jgi:phosphoglycerate dehydrogenase-like enzyme
MMLALRRRVPTMIRNQLQVTWPTGRWEVFSRPELRGSTLGIVGYGAVGREVARLAHAFGMRILAVSRSGERRPYRGYAEPGVGDPAATIPEAMYPSTELVDLLPACDFVVLTAPLTADTHHIINAGTLAIMKPSAYLINLGRGPLVEETALVESLRHNKLAGAGLDVFETEPLPAESALWQLDNVIISPHVSGFTPLYDERASDLFAENLRRSLSGEPLINLVDKERGY